MMYKLINYNIFLCDAIIFQIKSLIVIGNYTNHWKMTWYGNCDVVGDETVVILYICENIEVDINIVVG